jgi:hypothetical protein
MKLLHSTVFARTAVAAAVLWGAGVTARADYPSEVLALQPLTYWRFNDTGTFSFTATNLGTTGTNDNGLYSDPTYMQGQPGALFGSSDTAARFDGATSKIDVPFDAALNPTNFTVECWAKVEGGTGNYRSPVTSRESTDVVSAGYIFYAGAGNTWEFWTGSGTGWNIMATPATTGGVVIGAWTHLVGTYDATSLTMSFYINGLLILQATNVTVMPVGTDGVPLPLRVGAGATEGAGDYWFDGSVDEVAVYPSVLTPAQVAANYAVGTTDGGAYAAQVLALKPALYLRLDDTSTNPPAVNLGSLGAAANGRYLEGLEPSATDLASPAFPGFGSSNLGLVFNGTGQAVAIDYTNIPVPWTMTCWVNREDAPGVSAVLLYSSSTGLKLEQYGSPDRDVGFTAYGVADYTFNYEAPDGTWTHLAFVGTPDGMLLYTNGALADTNSATITLPMTSLGVVAGDLLSGTVDEVATFDRALMDGQIMTLYLTAIGSQNPPGFDNNEPIVTPAGALYATAPFSLSIDVYGAGPLSYQWWKDGSVVGTNAIYTVAAASATNAGNYSVIVTNAYGAVTSAVVNLVINPAVPASVAQPPVPRPVYPGGTAVFTVIANGTAPITYQWMKGGTNITGATSETLVITNAGPADVATYSVGVTNVAGSAVSAGAALTLLIPTPGTYAEQIVTNGPVAYWRLNETSGTTAYDYAGGDDGTNSSTVIQGVPGPTPPLDPGFESDNTCYQFDGTDTSVQAGSLGLPGPLSVSAWVNPSVPPAAGNDVGIAGELYSWAFKLSSAETGTELRFTTPGILDHTSIGAGVTAGVWQHVAATFDPGAAGGAKFYMNGQLVSSVDASTLNKGDSAFVIGDNQWGQFFDGDIDEVAVYNKVLSADTIASMYAVAAYGSITAPFVTRNPVSQTVIAGSAVSLSAAVQGSLPIAYQWQQNGVSVPGATGATLSLTNVYFTGAGNYVLWATNGVGYTNTAAATLTVMPPPTFANVTNGLVLHLSFEGGQLTDSSGNGNNGYAGGSPSFVPGRIGTNAVYVNTDTANSIFNYVYVNSSPTLVFDTNDSFSVSFWVKYTGLPNDLPMIGNSINSTYQVGWVFTDDYGQIECSLASNAGDGTYVQDPLPGSPVTDNGQWHNVVGIVDRGLQVASVYVDGALAGTWSIVGLGTMDYGNSITLGQDPTGFYTVNGAYTLDDVGMWKRALTSYEAVSIYGAGQANESFDVYGPVRLNFQRSGTNFDLNWQAGTLLQSTNVAGPYKAVTGATVPFYRAPGTGSSMFYRVQQ